MFFHTFFYFSRSEWQIQVTSGVIVGRTESREYPRWNAISLPDEDGQVRIVPFDSWVGRLEEIPRNGRIRQRRACILAVQGITNRVPAEAGEVWQHRILISRTAGEKALANADILICGCGRRQ